MKMSIWTSFVDIWKIMNDLSNEVDDDGMVDGECVSERWLLLSFMRFRQSCRFILLLLLIKLGVGYW
jgi:hypothetical protein